jgi:hypothetical protein
VCRDTSEFPRIEKSCRHSWVVKKVEVENRVCMISRKGVGA